MRTFRPTVCKLRRYHHHSFNINLKTDSIWYHTRNWDWSIPERCSRKPWRENMPSRPSTSTTWNRCRPSYRPASKPRRPSSCRFRAEHASMRTRPSCATWHREPWSMPRSWAGTFPSASISTTATPSNSANPASTWVSRRS